MAPGWVSQSTHGSSAHELAAELMRSHVALRRSCAATRAKLQNAVARQVRLKVSPSILTGRIFDDRGNRMSPTDSNKSGVRYRYYVSHAIVQQNLWKPHEASGYFRTSELFAVRELAETFKPYNSRECTPLLARKRGCASRISSTAFARRMSA